MYLHAVVALGLLAQTTVPAEHGPAGDPGVRLWVSDTVYQVGAGARVYVKLREPGYLVVLHTDALGRIRILYPVAPGDQSVVPAGAPFEVTGPDDGAAFRVDTRGRGTLLAARSPHPFQFNPLRHANRWDYEQALLLQPTAGNAFAALLDIADRVADGQPYDYDVTAYGTPGTLANRTAPDTVCFSCLTARHARSASSGSNGYGDAAVAIDHSYAAANSSSVVDCSGANLVNSFCGVQDNSVTSSYTDNSTYESNTLVYPVYLPYFVPFRRAIRPAPPMSTPPPPAITLPVRLRPASRRLVPPPPRPRPQIVVVQPTAPSHAQLTPDQPEPAEPVAMSAPAPSLSPRDARTRSAMVAPSGMVSFPRTMAPAFPMPAVTPSGAASTIARPMVGTVPRAFVPSRALLRSINAAHH
jgi:hypothetical protein